MRTPKRPLVGKYTDPDDGAVDFMLVFTIEKEED